MAGAGDSMDARGSTLYVVGLGNPEPRYDQTRHNVGFQVLAELRRRHPFDGPRGRFHSQCWIGRISGRNVWLVAPQTYMNLSGRAVGELLGFFKAAPADVLIVLDDMALPPGRLRARPDGSAGGHNGLDDILQALGTDAVPRLRVGVGSPAPGRSTVDYVLSPFDPAERPVMQEALAQAATAVEDWIENGIIAVMDRYNKGPNGSKPKQDGKDV